MKKCKTCGGVGDFFRTDDLCEPCAREDLLYRLSFGMSGKAKHNPHNQNCPQTIWGKSATNIIPPCTCSEEPTEGRCENCVIAKQIVGKQEGKYTCISGHSFAITSQKEPTETENDRQYRLFQERNKRRLMKRLGKPLPQKEPVEGWVEEFDKLYNTVEGKYHAPDLLKAFISSLLEAEKVKQKKIVKGWAEEHAIPEAVEAERERILREMPKECNCMVNAIEKCERNLTIAEVRAIISKEGAN